LVGREAALKELVELVRAQRCVTLTGVGGVGKTRLGVQVAGELATEFPDGVWLVELAAVGASDAVADATAAVLNVVPEVGLTVSDSLARDLSGRRLLLVLDNCEHVLSGARRAYRGDLDPGRDGEGDCYLARGVAIAC
jgi:predicted ATPase